MISNSALENFAFRNHKAQATNQIKVMSVSYLEKNSIEL